MTIYIANAFSLSMLNREQQAGTPAGYTPRSTDRIGRTARIPRPLDDPRALVAARQIPARVVSIVGHEDTARVLGGLLGIELRKNRVSIELAPEDLVIVGQLVGARLPEGATELPEGAAIEWWIV